MNDQEKETAAYPTPGCAASSRIRSALASFPGGKSLRFLRPLGFLGLCGLSVGGAVGADWPVLSLREAIERALNRHAQSVLLRPGWKAPMACCSRLAFIQIPLSFSSWKTGALEVAGVPAVARSGCLCLCFPTNRNLGQAGSTDRVGLQNTEQAALELQWRTWNVRQEVRRAYYGALLAQKRLQMMAENNQSFQQIVEYHRFRVREGAMAEADLIKVELEAERLSLDRETAALEGERSRFELLKAMGESATAAHFSLSDPGPIPMPATLASVSPCRQVRARFPSGEQAPSRRFFSDRRSRAIPAWQIAVSQVPHRRWQLPWSCCFDWPARSGLRYC